MISIDKASCIGLGYCWSNCPTVFAQDTDGTAKVKAGQENSTAPCVRESQANCCQGAIQIS
ncbi:MAG TPA: ferredoxin [Stenomitos sp.]